MATSTPLAPAAAAVVGAASMLALVRQRSARLQLRVVLESPIEAHDAQLYKPTTSIPVACNIRGFGGMNPAALKAFQKYGFIIIRRGFDDDSVEAAKAELQSMLVSDDPDCESVYFEGSVHQELSETERLGGSDPLAAKLALGVTKFGQLPKLAAVQRQRLIRKFMGFTHRRHKPLLNVAHQPDLLSTVEKLLGGERPQLFQDMAMIKPPHGGREKPFHQVNVSLNSIPVLTLVYFAQDHAYFSYPLATPIVGCWIALSPATAENGAMVVVPAGHKGGAIVHFRRRDFQICDTIANELPKAVVDMEAGDVLLFDSQLPHGTATNHTPLHRWALQYHYVGGSQQPGNEQLRVAQFGEEGKGAVC